MSSDLSIDRVIEAPAEAAFDALASPGGQREFYGKDEPGWIVESHCEFRVGGLWSIVFGPSSSELYRHEHLFVEIERPNRLRLATTEVRPDGSSFETITEFSFEPRGGATLMTMSQSGFPSEALRDEHRVGVPHAFERLNRVIQSSGRYPREERQIDV